MPRLLLVSILVAAPLSSAQGPVVTGYTLNVDVEFVQLPISVVDKEGYPVRGLTQEHFKIYEDRVMQDIALFKQEDMPLSVAQVTGARAFFPKSMNDVNEICRRIARDLRNQYTIGYRPSNDKLDGSWRKVTVQVNPPRGTPKFEVHTKQGYYAPSVPKRDPS